MKFEVDMVRLLTRVGVGEFNMFFTRYIPHNPSVNHYLKSRIQEYHYNFAVDELAVIPYQDGTFSHNRFYFGYKHNQERASSFEGSKYNLVIEFNPQKCDLHYGILKAVLETFFNKLDTIRLVSADFCLDIKDVSLDNVMIDRGLKRTYMDYQSNTGRTLYVGKRGSNGQVKVYDKAKELGLKDTILTRYECHLAFDDLYAHAIMGHGFQMTSCLPKVYFDTGQVSLIEDAKLRSCVYAVKNGFVNLKEFNPRFREKIKPYLEDTAKLIIDDTSLGDIRKSIISWFYWYCKEMGIN